jgi:Tol biopolymer transport system component
LSSLQNLSGTPFDARISVKGKIASQDYLATSIFDLQIWDSSTGASIARITHRQQVEAFSWSPDGSQIATAGDDGAIRFWNGDNGQLIRQIPTVLPPSVYAMAWSPDGSRLAIADGKSRITVWNIGQERLLNTSPFPDAPPGLAFGWNISWSPDSSKFVMANSIFDQDGKPLYMLESGYTQEWGATVWSPDGAKIAALDTRLGTTTPPRDNDIAIFDAHTGKISRRYQDPQYSHTVIDWDSTSTKLVTAGRSMIHIWELCSA